MSLAYSKNVKIGFFGSKTVDPVKLVRDKISSGELDRDRKITVTRIKDHKSDKDK